MPDRAGRPGASAGPRGLVLYFGTEMPDPAWAAGHHGTDVVVQPYHPMVKYGGYAETFPHARRWVYANPTTVDPWLLERATTVPPISHRDSDWNLPRLDLAQPGGVSWAVEHLQQTAAMVAEEAHGIFVDDLDRLVAQPDLALDLLARTRVDGAPSPRWFINRAFELLDRIEDLDAVLLECLTPAAAARMDVHGIRWVREVVVPALTDAAARGACCHSLDYPDQPEVAETSRVPDAETERVLGSLVSSVTHAHDRGLTVWQPRKSRPRQKARTWL